MSLNASGFNQGVVQPMDCFRAGWDLIKDQYLLFVGITFVGILLGSLVPLYLLFGAMMCGIHLCLLRRMRGETVGFDMLFKGFDYFVPSLVATLVQVVPVVLVVIVGYIGMIVTVVATAGAAASGAPPEIGAVFFVLMMVFVSVVLILTLVTTMFFIFSYPLVVDRGLSGVDACKTSAKAVMANFGGVLGLLILGALLSFAGLLLCYVGMFLTLPIVFAAVDVAYRQVFPEMPRQQMPDYFNQPPAYGAPYGHPPMQ